MNVLGKKQVPLDVTQRIPLLKLKYTGDTEMAKALKGNSQNGKLIGRRP